jgi:antirestriction protein ArdC
VERRAPGRRISRPLRWNGKPYSGINVIMLWAEATARNHVCPIWMTYKQAHELGGQVRTGETGSLVVYADRFTRKGKDTDPGEETEREIPFLKGYTVFNCEQIDGQPSQLLRHRRALEPRPDHASYIASWLKVLKDDKRAVFTAASHAQRAADFLGGLQQKGRRRRRPTGALLPSVACLSVWHEPAMVPPREPRGEYHGQEQQTDQEQRPGVHCLPGGGREVLEPHRRRMGA